jgi:CheY-like chemotaxis protein
MARFLVVDNEHGTVAALKSLLEVDGHDVDAFTNGSEAVAALMQSPFDAVLTDLAMPHVAGDVVVRAAREHQPGACVFVSTSRPHLAVLHDACHVFDKPLDYEGVLRAVTECRARRGPGRHGGCHMKGSQGQE